MAGADADTTRMLATEESAPLVLPKDQTDAPPAVEIAPLPESLVPELVTVPDATVTQVAPSSLDSSPVPSVPETSTVQEPHPSSALPPAPDLVLYPEPATAQGHAEASASAPEQIAAATSEQIVDASDSSSAPPQTAVNASPVASEDPSRGSPPSRLSEEASGAKGGGIPDVPCNKDAPQVEADSGVPRLTIEADARSTVPPPLPSTAGCSGSSGGGSTAGGVARQAQGRAVLWRKILLSRDQSEPNQHKPFTSWEVELNEPNQRVIRADCDRTRADLEYFRQPELRKKMEEMLTCWCKMQNVRYKQGLNEVLAPFLHLQTEPPGAAPSDDEVFAMFSTFLRRFSPFFDSDDFVPLQCAFVFFKRLLLYHHPNLYNYLAERDIHPEMFCTPWFLTIFASKTPLRIALQLWDRHLQRNEPAFFVFLAVAVLANAQQAVFASDRSGLPEVLTHLGLSSREELEQLWSLADTLHRTTPATFAARLRRNVLGIRASKSGQAKGAPGNADQGMEAATANSLLEKLEQERCFFILPEEVVGHCYPLRAGEAPQPWHPSPLRSWRLLVLDLRSNSEFEAGRLPTGLRFNLRDLLGGGQGAGAAVRRLLPWSTESNPEELDPATVFDGLKELLGEDWVCNNEAHICLLGSSDTEGSTAVKSLYDLMTMQLSLRHVSVASGGYEAVASCAQKQGFETIRSEESGSRKPRGQSSRQSSPRDSSPRTQASLSSTQAPGDSTAELASIKSATEDADQGASDESPSNLQAMDGSDSGRWGMKFAATAWSSLKKAAAAGAGKVAEGINTNHEGEGLGDQGLLVTAGIPVLRDRPGNWPLDLDLMSLPMRPRKGLFAPGTYWPCMAVVVRCSEQHRGTAAAIDTPWEGCRCVLAFVGDPPATRIVCATAVSQESAAMLADFEVSQVLRVTSKKQAPDSLIFYFREDPPGSMGVSDPAVILHFNNGAEDVRAFIKALRGKYPAAAIQERGARGASQQPPASPKLSAAPAPAPPAELTAASMAALPVEQVSTLEPPAKT